MSTEWYRWVDSQPGHVILDGGLGFILSQKGNDLNQGSLWSGRVLVEKPQEVSITRLLSYFSRLNHRMSSREF